MAISPYFFWTWQEQTQPTSNRSSVSSSNHPNLSPSVLPLTWCWKTRLWRFPVPQASHLVTTDPLGGSSDPPQLHWRGTKFTATRRWLRDFLEVLQRFFPFLGGQKHGNATIDLNPQRKNSRSNSNCVLVYSILEKNDYRSLQVYALKLVWGKNKIFPQW